MPHVPPDREARQAFFDPDLSALDVRQRPFFERYQRFLRSNLVDGRPIQRLGTLIFCLRYALEDEERIPGIWKTVREQFSCPDFNRLYELLRKVNEFRNKHVAHVETPLTDEQEARAEMRAWLTCLVMLVRLSR